MITKTFVKVEPDRFTTSWIDLSKITTINLEPKDDKFRLAVFIDNSEYLLGYFKTEDDAKLRVNSLFALGGFSLSVL